VKRACRKAAKMNQTISLQVSFGSQHHKVPQA
jgi:hypothetical protein